jgi:hypothetical protein
MQFETIDIDLSDYQMQTAYDKTRLALGKDFNESFEKMYGTKYDHFLRVSRQ